jgi:4'-phosphopantetheinyl transferase
VAAPITGRGQDTLRWHCAAIRRDDDWLARCAAVLSEQERARAAALLRAGPQTAYRSSHGALRFWLSSQLAIAPAALSLAPDAHGKPQLEALACSFNFSHSDTHWAAVLHACPRAQPGIDIEAVARFADVSEEMMAYMLSPSEQLAWKAVPSARRARLLARVWTRKEALLKAIGVGLARPMHGLTVGWAPGPLWVRAPDAGSRTMAHWLLCDLAPLPAGLAGALALRADRAAARRPPPAPATAPGNGRGRLAAGR